jgi:four helix bundle protein
MRGWLSEQMGFMRLDVFRAALDLRRATTALAVGERELREQINRASSSIVLNIGEGAGRWSKKEKRKYYEIARGSTSEIAAAVVLAHEDGLVSDGDNDAVQELAVRIVQMLTRLCQVMSTD